MTTQFIALLASAGLATVGLAATSATLSADALPTGVVSLAGDGDGGGGARICRVEIVRTGAGGTASTVRSELEGGQCLCTMTTGPANSNGSAENLVNALLRDRSCEGAPAAGAEETGGGGGVLGGVVGAAAIGGLAAGLGGKSNG